jgi:hypothetical protein
MTISFRDINFFIVDTFHPDTLYKKMFRLKSLVEVHRTFIRAYSSIFMEEE